MSEERDTSGPDFRILARSRQAQFRRTLSAGAQAPQDAAGKRHGHLLAHGHEIENLYPSLCGPGGALDFFGEREISWWLNARSTGDRPWSRHFIGPTRNLASSQVCCVNSLMPLAGIDGALLEFIRHLDPTAREILPLDHEGRTTPVEFEWMGWKERLESGPGARGAQETSVDAVIVARTAHGNRAYLMEWKYSESYPQPENRGAGESGRARVACYGPLFAHHQSSFRSGAAPLEDLLYDPFDQLLRLTLLGDKMLREGVTQRLRIEDFRVVVICPAANRQYRQVVEGTPMARRGATVEEAMRSTLKDASRIQMAAQEDLIARLRRGPLAGELRVWLDYHEARYGW